MWRSSTVAIHCDNQAEHKNKLCGKTTDFLTLNLAAYILTIGLLVVTKFTVGPWIYLVFET